MRELERELPATRTDPPPALTGGLTIVGPGRAGSSLAHAARAAGISVQVTGRGERVPPSSVILLCVPDLAVTEVCDELTPGLDPGAHIGHVSGALTLAALEPAAAHGHPAFSLHPLQTIPDTKTDLTAAPCAIAGSDSGALELSSTLATALGMIPFEVPETGRAAYHAAAAIASNFLIALEESAASLMAAAGVANPRGILTPLVLRSANNWASDGAGALTGPIARGDEGTIRMHRAALSARAPELAPMYDAMCERTRALAGERTS